MAEMEIFCLSASGPICAVRTLAPKMSAYVALRQKAASQPPAPLLPLPGSFRRAATGPRAADQQCAPLSHVAHVIERAGISREARARRASDQFLIDLLAFIES